MGVISNLSGYANLNTSWCEDAGKQFELKAQTTKTPKSMSRYWEEVPVSLTVKDLDVKASPVGYHARVGRVLRGHITSLHAALKQSSRK